MESILLNDKKYLKMKRKDKKLNKTISIMLEEKGVENFP